MNPSLFIATRSSPLALWQTHRVLDQLSDPRLSLKTFTTSGDQGIKLWGKNSFTKELHEAILSQQCHFAVHSLKDMPLKAPEPLVLAAVLPRQSPADVLLLGPRFEGKGLDERSVSDYKEIFQDLDPLKNKIDSFLSYPMTLATSSLRRANLFEFYFKQVTFFDWRGNIGTRIEKFKDHQWDCALLAHAGLQRLNLFDPKSMLVLNPREFIPSPTQGVIVIEMARDSLIPQDLLEKIKFLNHVPTALSCALERLTLSFLEGGCQSPMGIYCDYQCIYVYYKHPKKGSLFFNYVLQEKDFQELALISRKLPFFYQWEEELLKTPLAHRLHLWISQWV